MKKYQAPSAIVLELSVSDVIALSAEDLFAEFDDVVEAPDSWF